jgi:hypothetical protein
MRKLIFLLLLMIPLLAESQNRAFESFFQLSGAEKKWTLTHPFVAVAAWRITQKCRYVTDSLGKLGFPDRDPSGGKLDAFRHSFWMATLTEKIGQRKALSLGRAHERGNYRDFKKKRYEEEEIPDKTATDMDLFNNAVGSGIGVALKNRSKKIVIDSILKAIAAGKMVVIFKDSLGLSCDSSQMPIPKKEMHGKWITPRMLVPSDNSFIPIPKKQPTIQ